MKTLAFLLLTIFIPAVQGQNPDTVSTQATSVIAAGGLRLRENPGTQAKIKTTIPFGAKIKYLSNKAYGKDSIGIQNGQGEAEILYGVWVKVAYKNQQGFVLNIYLYDRYSGPNRFEDNVNDDAILLYPGCGCNNENIHNPDSRKWYGYFENEKNKLTVEPIALRYYATGPDYDYTCPLIISASKTKNLKFMIGYKSGIREKTVQAKAQQLPIDPMEGAKGDILLPSLSLELIHRETWPGDLYLKKDGQKQLLSRKDFDYPATLEFMGDIDGDAKDDYIISYGDKGAISVLYLTGKAPPGTLLRQVSIFHKSYCC